MESHFRHGFQFKDHKALVNVEAGKEISKITDRRCLARCTYMHAYLRTYGGQFSRNSSNDDDSILARVLPIFVYPTAKEMF